MTERPWSHVCERRLHLSGDDLESIAERLLLSNANFLVINFLNIVEIVSLKYSKFLEKILGLFDGNTLHVRDIKLKYHKKGVLQASNDLSI